MGGAAQHLGAELAGALGHARHRARALQGEHTQEAAGQWSAAAVGQTDRASKGQRMKLAAPERSRGLEGLQNNGGVRRPAQGPGGRPALTTRAARSASRAAEMVEDTREE